MSKVGFTVKTHTFHSRGEEMRCVKINDVSPQHQLLLMNKAIVGYDPYHPDSPDTAIYRFSVPVVDNWQAFCNVWANMMFGRR